MISYSTGTSGTGADVEKVREATKIAQQKRPDLIIDGPLQYDAAIMENVALKKAPNSPVAGKATVFIFPDLNTGNTTYKAVQRSADLISIGPMLQGMRKPVNDLSRGALVDDIVYTIALTAIQAAQVEALREIGMLAASRVRRKKQDPFVARSSVWVRAPQSGIFRMLVPMGASVNKGDLLGMVAAPYGREQSETEVFASSSGIVIGRTNIPLVNEGEALFHIARFNKPDEVADSVQAFHSDLDPATDTAVPDEMPII